MPRVGGRPHAMGGDSQSADAVFEKYFEAAEDALAGEDILRWGDDASQLPESPLWPMNLTPLLT